MNAAIRVEKLDFAYSGAKPVLRGVTFSVPEGESFGVIRTQWRGKIHNAAAS